MNFMDEYHLWRTAVPTFDPNNLFALRRDLHHAFDKNKAFVFVPKEGKPVVHFFEAMENLAPAFHNREARNLQVHKAFVFTRFAWALFPINSPILNEKNVHVRVFDFAEGKYIVQKMTPEQMRERVAIKGPDGYQAKRVQVFGAGMDQICDELEQIAARFAEILPPGTTAKYQNDILEISTEVDDEEEFPTSKTTPE